MGMRREGRAPHPVMIEAHERRGQRAKRLQIKTARRKVTAGANHGGP